MKQHEQAITWWGFAGFGACGAGGGTGSDTRPGLCGPVVNWCDECWGSAFWSATILPMGASVRLGRMLAEALTMAGAW